MTEVFNKTTELYKRRLLRRNMPQAEILLWSKLRGTGLKGHKFRRQYGVKNYVLDFYCPKQKLAIEIDGDSHLINGAEEYDRERQAVIETYGIRFLRFTNEEVSENTEGVVMRIMEHLPYLPQPLLGKEGSKGSGLGKEGSKGSGLGKEGSKGSGPWLGRGEEMVPSL